MYPDQSYITPPQGLDAFGPWFNEIFRVWGARWGTWVLMTLVYFSIIAAPILVLFAVFGSVAALHTGSSGAVFAGMIPLFILVYLAIFAVSFLLMPGFLVAALKQLRGQEISVGDLFSGTRHAGAFFVIGLCVALGMLGCVIGVYVTMAFFYLAFPLVVDREMSIGDALSTSWNVVKQNFWLYLLFAFVVNLLASAGSWACYIGILASFPWMFIGQAIAYERTFNPAEQPYANYPTQPPPPPYMPPPPYNPPTIDTPPPPEA